MSSIFHDHHGGKTRAKKNLEDEASLDNAGTGTLENLSHARRCGNTDEFLNQISSYSITVINISGLDTELKIKPLKSLHCIAFIGS